jgi:hypothetical protein
MKTKSHPPSGPNPIELNELPSLYYLLFIIYYLLFIGEAWGSDVNAPKIGAQMGKGRSERMAQGATPFF